MEDSGNSRSRHSLCPGQIGQLPVVYSRLPLRMKTRFLSNGVQAPTNVGEVLSPLRSSASVITLRLYQSRAVFSPSSTE